MRMKNLLFALCGMMVCLSCSKEAIVKVTFENPAEFDRREVVELAYQEIATRLSLKENESLMVTNEQGKVAPVQLVFEGAPEPVKIVFPVMVTAKGRALYIIKKTHEPADVKMKAYGRLVPERKDDICWENDRIAFRAYGPALEATGEISNGYDIWVKRSEDTVINKRYRMELEQGISYHNDNGDGLDNYKVGRTLGAGAMAPYLNDTLWLANNFVKCEILDNGPVRFTCRLEYAPFDVDGHLVSEVRTITLDAGSQFNKVVDCYKGLPEGAKVAAGIVLHGEDTEYFMDKRRGYTAYVEPVYRKEDGETYVATVFPQAITETREACGHILAVVPNNEAGNLYYFGAGWNRWGFDTSADWYRHVQQFASMLRFPLKVTMQ